MGNHSAKTLVRFYFDDGRDARFIDVTDWQERDGDAEFFLPVDHPAARAMLYWVLNDDIAKRMVVASADAGIEWHLHQAQNGVARAADPYGPRSWVRFLCREHTNYLRPRLLSDEWARKHEEVL
ncbi:hypothetical protein FDI14_gp085 [Mycobacterium phage SirDuracell]|uniref:Uncharacterized protein n=1 Tax=Mycobacterium phage SirDuracell TaxID=1034116 RepID=G1D5V0_9CAUD|nr:hypothetical protein FDI14_gp085 [Mycobacterium phage SirDuracell]AEK10150.1 hypothetical protein PBI_SIRDURACELL_85 [Mycobacterium phage SirDuracell]